MRSLLLAGGGHAHALVLRAWAQRPPPGVALTVLSPSPFAPYSGMVPGWLAGHYRFDDIVIDIAALAAAAGARFVADEIVALDPDARRVHLACGATLDFDCLSLNIGSTLTPPANAPCPVLPLRPLASLRPRLEALVDAWACTPSDRPFTVSAAGGGAAGVESLLALLARLRALQPGRTLHGHLHVRGPQLLPDLASAAQRWAAQALTRAGVAVHLGQAWQPATDRGSDLLLWATGAEAHGWQQDPTRRGTLAVDAAGFVQVDATLRSLSHPHIFAAGDCASLQGQVLPKSGVYAVRMGPVLVANLCASVIPGSALQEYHAQRQALVLLATGDGRAIASRGPWLAAQGRWVWCWKDHIDRGFVAGFRRPRT